jgi:hypothetical protein
MNNQDIQQLNNQIKQLQDDLSRLKLSFSTHFHDGNNSMRVNFSDLFSVNGTGAYPTATTTVPSGGGNVTAPAQPSGTLSVTVGNNTYKLIYQ